MIMTDCLRQTKKPAFSVFLSAKTALPPKVPPQAEPQIGFAASNGPKRTNHRSPLKFPQSIFFNGLKPPQSHIAIF
ncbi:MAG: hypothetical protein ACOH2J_18195 [Allorhizobium sp.]